MLPRLRLLLIIPAVALVGCGPFVPVEFLDGARKTEELAQLFAAQRVDQMSPGSVTLGEAGSLGPSGKASLGVRATMVSRGVPSVAGSTLSTTGSTSAPFPTETSGALAFSADGALTIWRGLRIGGSHTLGLTALGSVALLPALDGTDIRITGGGGLAFGGGLRVGVLEEGRTTPAVAFSTVVRTVPTMGLQTGPIPTDDGDSMTLTMDRLSGSVLQFRIAVSKHFGKLGVIIGTGDNSYEGTADLTLARSPSTSSPYREVGQSISFSRLSTFVGGTYQLGRWTLGAEVGRLSFDDASQLYPVSEGQGSGGKTYLSVGMRVGN